VLWIKEMNVMLFVQGKVEIAVMPAVAAVLVHHRATDTWTECYFVSTG